MDMLSLLQSLALLIERIDVVVMENIWKYSIEYLTTLNSYHVLFKKYAQTLSLWICMTAYFISGVLPYFLYHHLCQVIAHLLHW